MQQDKDPEHRSKSTSEWLQQKKIHLQEWPSPSPDLDNVTETLWYVLKGTIRTRRPKNVAEVTQILSRGMNLNCFHKLLNPTVRLLLTTLHCECGLKKWIYIIVCVWCLFKEAVCLLLRLRRGLEHILWPVYLEIQVIPKGSHTSFLQLDNTWRGSLSMEEFKNTTLKVKMKLFHSLVTTFWGFSVLPHLLLVPSLSFSPSDILSLSLHHQYVLKFRY